eukprot:CAMPEP_0177622842 /NCGR_PEP_ID=MMETSP0419_2-20121207/28558_1 /TAXON_ID=582737 /ORGANISM="Tetraselmis sp., Strain GSL018" /LENGTH=852 /DNA_ID=CAMNT_0019123301 /DNA_START=64 /DNA_END=2621 /DNA_ORIENTATION=-
MMRDWYYRLWNYEETSAARLKPRNQTWARTGATRADRCYCRKKRDVAGKSSRTVFLGRTLPTRVSLQLRIARKPNPCEAILTELGNKFAEELANASHHRAPVSAGDLLLRQHTAGWYCAVVAGILALAITFYQYLLLVWSMMESSIFSSDLDEEEILVYGVDVSGSALLTLPEVRKAMGFAAEAHRGQMRRTKEPYVAHCIETALIVEALMGAHTETVRARTAVTCALLHDVIDDTRFTDEDLRAAFGPEVADIVAKVSHLSTLNQLLRRRKRLLKDLSSEAGERLSSKDAELRQLIVSMVDEPLVILIKLADRLHNMRTIYALKRSKQRAVAQETLSVWCSLAERLGMFALKAELEDLCFAVLHPTTYLALYMELQAVWGAGEEDGDAALPEDEVEVLEIPIMSPDAVERPQSNRDVERLSLYMRNLLATVPRFEAVTFSSQRRLRGRVCRGLAEVETCARRLLQELSLEAYAPGLDVCVQGRLKSLYSVHNKMTRKGVGIAEVYDARALRVIVDDHGGKREAAAIAACYRLLPAVHRLWRPIRGESDDYIANPKASGYQSLHTAVVGPRGIPLEIQIRTSSMHEEAEYGRASHWVYKEGIGLSTQHDVVKARPVRGQPVLRIDGGSLRDGVVVRAGQAGNELLCATFMGGRLSTDGKRPLREDYRNLLDYVDHRGWWVAGHGDARIALEEFILCSDGQYHRVDHYGRIMATRLQLLVRPVGGGAGAGEAGGGGGPAPEQLQMREKIHLLRSMLEWGREVDSADGAEPPEGNIMVLLWPKGSILRLSRGTTAGELLALQGGEDDSEDGSGSRSECSGESSRLVNVNNKLVPGSTTLDDGDMVILTHETVTI